MTRALLVDLGNVLVRFDHDLTIGALSRATGRPGPELRHAIFDSGLERELDLGRLGADQLFREVEARLHLGRLPDEVWIPAWRDIFSPIPEALDLLGRLAPTVRTALVSNTNALHWEGVQRVCDVATRVDALALSFQVGAVKPDPRIFDAALCALSAGHASAVFADDRADLVAAARDLGIDGFVVADPAGLRNGLLERGLLTP